MITRRRFLKNSTLAAATPLVLSSAARARAADSPNAKLSHAAIGVDGQGWGDLLNLSSHPEINITAICDVDTARMAKAAAKFPDARRYQDWRELLDKEGDKIDSVNVTVPDHMHAPISVSAMNLGKHCFCEKPLTHEVHEARQMRLVAEKQGVATQMGNQIHSSLEYRSAVVLVQEGAIGKIKEIHAWSGGQFPQRGRPEGADPIPETLDWQKWLGVAPERPFKNGIYHPFNWRGWVDFGGGAIGDFGCHILDTPTKALGLTAPISITAEVPKDWTDNPKWNTENWPNWEIFKYVFPGTEFTAGKTIDVTWYDGEKQPPRSLFPFEDEKRGIPGGGSLFVGETGTLLLPHVGGPQLVPYSKNKDLKRPKLEPVNHYHSFVDACLGKGKASSNFSYARPLTESVLLGNIANRFPGQTLNWNTEALEITGNKEATALVRRTYRDGWKVKNLSA